MIFKRDCVDCTGNLLLDLPWRKGFFLPFFLSPSFELSDGMPIVRVEVGDFFLFSFSFFFFFLFSLPSMWS